MIEIQTVDWLATLARLEAVCLCPVLRLRPRPEERPDLKFTSRSSGAYATHTHKPVACSLSTAAAPPVFPPRSHWDFRPLGAILALWQGDRKDIEEGNVAAGRDSDIRRLEHRSARSPGEGVLAALEGAALIVWNLVATPFIGRRRLRWGAVGTETSDSLPGDEFVPEPKWSYNLGIAVDASPEEVWPWIAQIGQGRGGFYTYQTLENMAGCKITNTTEILREHQHPAVGEGIYLHPTAQPLRIGIVDPPNALVLVGSPAGIGEGMSTWQFVVNPGPNGGSRLLTRGRYDYTADWKSRLAFGRFPIEAITFVMSRKMMLEIKRLAEREG